jgi:hypothetical protein
MISAAARPSFAVALSSLSSTLARLIMKAPLRFVPADQWTLDGTDIEQFLNTRSTTVVLLERGPTDTDEEARRYMSDLSQVLDSLRSFGYRIEFRGESDKPLSDILSEISGDLSEDGNLVLLVNGQQPGDREELERLAPSHGSIVVVLGGPYFEGTDRVVRLHHRAYMLFLARGVFARCTDERIDEALREIEETLLNAIPDFIPNES